jgi:DNA-binding NtrC family response regulator
MSTASQDLFLNNGAQSNETQVAFEQGMTLADIERAVILETLKRQSFNRTRAARVLGIGIRTLQRKLKQYRGDLSLPMLADA